MGEIMSTLTTSVVILTKNLRIEGEVDLLPGARLTDFMNKSNKFIVVTDARVTDHKKKKLLKGEFVDVLVKSIEVILPAEYML